MTAKLTYTTRRQYTVALADEKTKGNIRKEYIKQDKESPFRLFVATSGRPTIHLFKTKEWAESGFDEYTGVTRILMDMRSGHILKYARK